jgi:hypothetical protein
VVGVSFVVGVDVVDGGGEVVVIEVEVAGVVAR